VTSRLITGWRVAAAVRVIGADAVDLDQRQAACRLVPGPELPHRVRQQHLDGPQDLPGHPLGLERRREGAGQLVQGEELLGAPHGRGVQPGVLDGDSGLGRKQGEDPLVVGCEWPLAGHPPQGQRADQPIAVEERLGHHGGVPQGRGGQRDVGGLGEIVDDHPHAPGGDRAAQAFAKPEGLGLPTHHHPGHE